MNGFKTYLTDLSRNRVSYVVLEITGSIINLLYRTYNIICTYYYRDFTFTGNQISILFKYTVYVIICNIHIRLFVYNILWSICARACDLYDQLFSIIAKRSATQRRRRRGGVIERHPYNTSNSLKKLDDNNQFFFFFVILMLTELRLSFIGKEKKNPIGTIYY